MPKTIPSIISANTYFWKASGSSSQRRSNEERHANTVRDFFTSQGFEEKSAGVYVKGDAVAEFSYSESCKNVYKHFSVAIKGKRSNIRGLAKYFDQE